MFTELNLVSDTFQEQVMAGRAMKCVLHKHRDDMQRIFDCYAGEDARKANFQNTRPPCTTLTIQHLHQMGNDFPGSLYNSRFGLREMVSAFVRVNIDDELYEQDNEADSSSELIFDEFEEVVARIFNSREWEEDGDRSIIRDLARQARLGATSLEQAFDIWLEDSFLPAMLSFRADLLKHGRAGALAHRESRKRIEAAGA